LKNFRFLSRLEIFDQNFLLWLSYPFGYFSMVQTNFKYRQNGGYFEPVVPKLFDNLEKEILTFWRGKFWQFEKGNFDSLKKEILTVWKGKFWQFEKANFDSLKREILTVWKEKFWQFWKGNFDSLEREILTVWKGKFWQFGKGNFDSLGITVLIRVFQTIISIN
jgi:hypothetical protein